MVVSGAEGNPFYIEELIKMLIEDGVIVKSEERWRVEPVRLAQIRVPPTLTGILQARLDSLPPEERTVLQQASVVGRIFWDAAVARIGETTGQGGGEATRQRRDETVRQRTSERETEIQSPESRIENALSALRDREMVYRRETSAFAGAGEYIFKHTILRQVTYESVLKRLRRVYHGLIAEWLIEQGGERAVEVTGLVAHHLELAGQTERAVTYLRRAGEGAAARFANAEAVSYLSRALALTPEEKQAEHYAMLLARQQVYYVQGARELQLQDLLALKEIAEVLADDRRRAEVALHHAFYADITSDYPTAIAMAQEAAELAQASQVVHLEAEGHLEWGRTLWYYADYENARSQFEQALALARAAQLSRIEATTLFWLGTVNLFYGNYADTKAYLEQALPVLQEIGDSQQESITLNQLAFLILEQGEGGYTQARAYIEGALPTSRQSGNRIVERFLVANLGVLSDHQGDYTQARAYFDQALLISREIDDRRGEGLVLSYVGNTCRNQGDYTGAKVNYEESLRILREIGYRQGQGRTLGELGLLTHQMGDDEAAHNHSQRALVIARDHGVRREQGYALTRIGHALTGLGQFVEAADAYRQALAIQHEMGQYNRAVEAQAGLARLFLIQNDLKGALAQAEEILSLIDNIPWCGLGEPFRVYLTCYRVLKANQDPRAREILNTAYHLLQERAAKVSDEEMRRSFLENVTAHREIVRDWQEA
jgi:predicted ATPase